MSENIYDQFAERYEAAYAAFKRTYELRVPPPVREIVKRENPLVMLTLLLIVVASIIVSGSRTVNAFGGGVVGMSGFVMIECTIVAYAFIRTRINYDAEKHTSVKRRVGQGLALAFIVGVSANIYEELKINDVAMADLLDTMILVVLGISAPVLAFISGDVLGMYAVRDANAQRKADEEYKAALVAWNEGLKKSWDTEKGKWGIKLEALSVQSPSNGIPLDIPLENERRILPSVSTLGHSKQPQASKLVRDYLAQNPHELDGNPLDIAAHLNVGKSTVYNVMNDMRNERLSSNGNGAHDERR